MKVEIYDVLVNRVVVLRQFEPHISTLLTLDFVWTHSSFTIVSDKLSFVTLESHTMVNIYYPCYLKDFPLSKVGLYVLYTTFREMAVLPASSLIFKECILLCVSTIYEYHIRFVIHIA
jgi:hypothetical protein